MPSPVGGGLTGGSAPVAFVSGAADVQVDSDIVVEWDFDNDGDFDQPVEDITSFVMAAETLTGRDWPSNLQGAATAGQLRLTLLNDDDRFSYFNTDSPMATGGFSLRTGRKIRVRTVESTPSDPRLLARDRFNRPDGPLFGTEDELGNRWEPDPAATHTIISGRVRGNGVPGESYGNVLPLGNEPEMYAQVTLASPLPVAGTQRVSLMVREHGSPRNALVARFRATDIILAEQVNGVFNTLGTYDVAPWEGCTLGVSIDANDVGTAWLNGIPVIVSATSIPATGGSFNALAFSEWLIDYRRPPAFDNFYVWDKPITQTEGVIWTGDVTEVNTTVTPGGTKLAEVTAVGTLARAAGVDVRAPRVVGGSNTGLLVGDVLSRAELLNPPSGGIDVGSVTTGPVYIDDGNALTLARRFEATELGFLHETPEGPPGFQDRTTRDTLSSAAWFTDTPGQGQYRYSAIAPLDFKREVINRVVVPVVSSAPTVVSLDRITDSGVALSTNHVDVTLPSVTKGDILAVFISSSVANSDVNWLTPVWWHSWRDAGSDIRMRVYDHICDGSESGDVIRFYDDSTSTGGSWIAHIYRIQNWYQNPKGVQFEEHVAGRVPPPLVPQWGKHPTLYITAFAAIQALAGISAGDLYAPSGYEDNDIADLVNTPAGGEVGLYTAYRVSVDGSETPGPGFTGLDGAIIYESCTYALRGFHGAFTDPVSLIDPTTVGGEGRFVTREDVESQAEHNAVMTLPNPGDQFATEPDAEAYADAVLERYADDRPIISLSFFATSSEALREQAFARRVGERITVTATGDTGLGFERDFYIETIGHTWSNAAKLWQVTWQLSPA